MKKLTSYQVIALHEMLIKRTGGLDGIRDNSLLESAVNSPYQTFDGNDLYPTIECKAARICYSLIKNHPFVDGNKRIGILAMLTFLENNGIELEFTDDELVNIGLKLASGEFCEKQLITWISLNN